MELNPRAVVEMEKKLLAAGMITIDDVRRIHGLPELKDTPIPRQCKSWWQSMKDYWRRWNEEI